MPPAETPIRISNTPILDSGVLQSRRRRKNIKGIFVGIAIGAMVGFGLARIVDQQADQYLDVNHALLLWVAAFTLAIVIHEFGHVLAGWALGFRFSFISVGPFSLRVEHGVLKIRIRRDMPALGYAGMNVCQVRRLRSRLLIYIAAGPAANLISIPVIVPLVNYAFPWPSNTWVAALAARFAGISLLSALLSLVPFGFGSMVSSDGSRILMLATSRERARRWLNIIAIGGQQRNGVRPKEWRRTWLKAASSLRDESLDEFSANWLAYISANARKDAASADAHLERCLELVPLLRPTARDLVAQEAAVYTAWFRNDPGQADKWFAQVKKPKLMTTTQQLRAGIALQCAHGDFVGALDSWQKGFVFIQKLPIGPQQASLMESWQEWRIKIQKRQNPIAAP